VNLAEIRSGYLSEGHDIASASSKTCQDIILSKIAKSPLSCNIAIKGGVIIQHISKDKRRATRDFDLDFIRYSLGDDAIREFVSALNDVEDGVAMNIVAPIEELNHQDYNGKRVILELTDRNNTRIGAKLDIGVHSKVDVEQEEYCFELDNIGESVTLLINSKEQMFTEKLRSLLKLGRFSTRYKDIFDFYYLIYIAGLNKERLMKCFAEYIFDAEDMRENNIDDIHARLSGIFRNKAFIDKAGAAHNNWLELPIADVTRKIIMFFTQ
jgi:hypothetical protein